MTREAFHCAPKFEAGCRMPSAATIEVADINRHKEAEIGSEALLAALGRYFERGGRG